MVGGPEGGWADGDGRASEDLDGLLSGLVERQLAMRRAVEALENEEAELPDPDVLRDAARWLDALLVAARNALVGEEPITLRALRDAARQPALSSELIAVARLAQLSSVADDDDIVAAIRTRAAAARDLMVAGSPLSVEELEGLCALVELVDAGGSRDVLKRHQTAVFLAGFDISMFVPPQVADLRLPSPDDVRESLAEAAGAGDQEREDTGDAEDVLGPSPRAPEQTGISDSQAAGPAGADAARSEGGLASLPEQPSLVTDDESADAIEAEAIEADRDTEPSAETEE
jgi:hypothetical protein